LGIAVTHILDVGHKFEEAPYLATLFVALILMSLAVSALFLVARRLDGAWVLSIPLAALPLMGYVLSRTVGLPQIADHVGHWNDPVGTASLVFELLLLGMALGARSLAANVAPAGALFASGLIAGGTMFSGASHVHGEGHEHGQGDGHTHQHASGYPDLSKATAQQLQGAEGLWRRTLAAAGTLLPTYSSALQAGYVLKWPQLPEGPTFFHLRRSALDSDGAVLDPSRVESLVYWRPRGGTPVLVGFMYRAETVQPPKFGGPIIYWHSHGSNPIPMTHVWLTGDVRTAYARCAPVRPLEKAVNGFAYDARAKSRIVQGEPCPG
jgi:hypothetical protein